MITTPHHHDAWLLDLYPERDRIVLWWITQEGRRLRLTQPFQPVFHVDGLETELTADERRRFFRTLEELPGLQAGDVVTRRDFWTDRPRQVQAVRVVNLDRFQSDVLTLSDRFPMLTYYDCDIAPEIFYCYDTGLFPTARCRIAHDDGVLTASELIDDVMATDYELPPLRHVEVNATGRFHGNRPRLQTLELKHEGRTITWDTGDTREMLLSFRDELLRIDPDVIWTEGGDTTLMRILFQLGAQLKIDLALDREPGMLRRHDYDGRTYMSYGRVLYHAPDYPLYGRLHFDRLNSFWVETCSLDGLAEVGRLSRIPLQRAARRSIGTGISSIQLEWAWRYGYLIPWRKSQHEAWKSAAQLMRADRGGLVFQPQTGVYEDVWELDFISMYPSIMVNENVSPETIDCDCCERRPMVPELGYSLCRRRRGLTAGTLAPIIARRNHYKEQRRRARECGDGSADAIFDRRQNALKWLLVCCFGYLGYRNARSGRIEAHESTCAFSREKLLCAKAICEARGFQVVHAIVDSFWIRKPGTTHEEIEALCGEIDAATNLRIAVEGRYRWLALLPSRLNDELPVPNRYFGVFEDGSLKFRGIETRRSDQAPFVRRFQRRLIDTLARADDLAACRAMQPQLAAMVREAEAAIRSGKVPVEQLLLSRKTSRAAEDYRSNHMVAVAVRQAKRAGLNLHAGETVTFLVLHQGDRDLDARLRLVELLQAADTYDQEFYVGQLHSAVATVLEPLFEQPLTRILDVPNPPRRYCLSHDSRTEGSGLPEKTWQKIPIGA